jgi:hypothetical protein
LAPPLVKTIKLDGKYKTSSFFGVKLLKCHFENKINLKNTPPPQKLRRFEKKKKRRRRRTVGLAGMLTG